MEEKIKFIPGYIPYQPWMMEISHKWSERIVFALIWHFGGREPEGCRFRGVEMAAAAGFTTRSVHGALRNLERAEVISKERSGGRPAYKVIRKPEDDAPRGYVLLMPWADYIGKNWTERMVFCLIYSFSRRGGLCYMGLKKMARFVGAGEDTVMKALSALMDAGMINPGSEDGSWAADMEKVAAIAKKQKKDMKRKEKAAPAGRKGRKPEDGAPRREDYAYRPPHPQTCGTTRLPDVHDVALKDIAGVILRKEKEIHAREACQAVGFTFDNEVKRTILELAGILQDGRGIMGLALCGVPGAGKTTAAKAFAYAAAAAFSRQNRSRLMNIEQISATRAVLLYMHENWAMLDRIINADLLLLDDVGLDAVRVKAYGNEWHPLRDIIKARYGKGKFTVMTTNLPYMELAKRYGPELEDRMLGSFAAIPFVGGAFRTKPQKYD